MTVLRRAFLAVVPSPEVLGWTESVVDAVRRPDDRLRWTRPEQRHVTVRFLGRVDDPDPVCASVAGSLRPVAPFTMALGGAGAFPSPRRASVVWLGDARGAGELHALARAVADATSPLGFVEEGRAFRPHLTLARSNRARDVRALVAALDERPAGPAWIVDRIVLFDSDTRPDGAVHREWVSFPLDAQGRSPTPLAERGGTPPDGPRSDGPP